MNSKLKRMSLILSSLFFSLFLSTAVAEKTGFSVILNDGSSQNYFFNEHPEMSFDSGEMTITTNDSKTTFFISNVKELLFSDNLSAINSPTEKGLSYSLDSHSLKISNIPDGEILRLLSINGSVIYPSLTISNGSSEIELATLEKGVYLLQTSNHGTLKFIVNK